MRTKEDFKTMAKIQQLCEKYDKGGWLSWENELYISDVEKLTDDCKTKGKAIKNIKEMIKKYYEEIGRAVTEPNEHNEDSILLRKITLEAKKMKVPSKYIVVEKLKDD